jgi:hypothetical protein
MDSGLKGLAMNAPSVAGVKQAKWPTFRDVLRPGLTLARTELKSSNAASLVMLPAVVGISSRRGPRRVIIDACGRRQWEKRVSEIIALN